MLSKENSEALMQIYNTNGQCLLQNSFIALNGLQTYSVDIKHVHFTPGIYLILLNNNKVNHSRKIFW